MNILQVIYSLSQGGAERFVVNPSNELTEKGHKVTLCTFRDDETDPAMSFNLQFLNEKVHYVNLKISSGLSIKKINRIENLVKNIRPDIIHCHLNVIPYFYRLAVTNRKIKIFHTLHSLAEKTYGNKLQFYINKFFYTNLLIRPVTISRECQLSFEKLYKLPEVPNINNGCPEVLPSPLFSKTKKEVAKYKTNTTEPVFVHVARFHPLKNQELLVDAFNKLAAVQNRFTLLIIGNGFDTPKGLELQRKACRNIHFLGLKPNVGDYLLCSDAFCLTSHYEGLPISLLEALSCGCVPICTAVGGITDVITNNRNGYLSSPSSETAYLEKLLFFMEYPKNITKSSLKEYFQQNYSMSICTNKYISLFEQ